MSLTHTDLRSAAGSFGGQLVFPDDAEYDGARRVWNLSIDRRPAVIARCTDQDDVVIALRIAREHGLPVAVRSGGHSFAGHSTCDDGMVIDLGALRELHIDAGTRTMTVGPGYTWAEIADATAPYGLAAAGGHVSAVGTAGLTLGGGNGWLSRAHGLACDNLLSADVVTATGDLVTASAGENQDLFWGLRGGGGNLGIVVRFRHRLHPVATPYAGVVVHRTEHARAVLRFLSDFVAAASDETTAAGGIMIAPPAPFVPPELVGEPVVLLAACSFAEVADDATAALAPLRDFGQPAVAQFQPTPWVELQHFFDGSGISSPSHMRSHLTGALTDDVVDTLVEHALPLTSPLSAVIVLPMGGAVARVAPDATAYRHRDARFCLEFSAAWPSPDEDPGPHRAWTEGLWEAIRPWSIGVEVNHLNVEGDDGVRRAYGPNYDRLAEIKRTWDPDNVFRINQNVPPGP